MDRRATNDARQAQSTHAGAGVVPEAEAVGTAARSTTRTRVPEWVGSSVMVTWLRS